MATQNNPDPGLPQGPTPDPQPIPESDGKDNERVETMVRRWVGTKRGRWMLIAAVVLVGLCGACVVWVRSDDGIKVTPPPPAPTVEPMPTVDVAAMVIELLDQREEERSASVPATPTIQPPNLIAAKLTHYIDYRYYHFLEEYRQCFGDRADALSAGRKQAPEGASPPTESAAPTPGADGQIAPPPTPIPPEPRTELELELETLAALPQAVSALMTMYDRGDCNEPDEYAVYRGRGTWLRYWQ